MKVGVSRRARPGSGTGTAAETDGCHGADVAIVTAMAAVYAFSFFQRVAVPGTIFDEVQHAFALSSASVALLGGVYLYIYGAMQLPAGALIDRFGGVRVTVVAGALMAVGAVAFPLSRSVAALFTARVLVALGASVVYLCVIKEVDRRFSDRRFPAILGVVGFAGSVGGLMGTFPLQKAIETFGWRGAMLAVGIATWVAVLIAAVLSRTSGSTPTATSSGTVAAIGEVIRNRASLPPIAGAAIVFGSYFVVQTVLGKKLMTDCCGMSPTGAAGCTLAMVLTVICCVILVGHLPSLIGFRRRPVQIAGSAAAALASGSAVLCLTLGADGRWMLACYILMAAASTTSIMFTCSVKELNSPRVTATSVGVQNTACYLGIAVLVTAAGVIMDRFAPGNAAAGASVRYPPEAYASVFLLLFALCCASVVLASRTKETRGLNRYDEFRNLMG